MKKKRFDRWLVRLSGVVKRWWFRMTGRTKTPPLRPSVRGTLPQKTEPTVLPAADSPPKTEPEEAEFAPIPPPPAASPIKAAPGREFTPRSELSPSTPPTVADRSPETPVDLPTPESSTEPSTPAPVRAETPPDRSPALENPTKATEVPAPRGPGEKSPATLKPTATDPSQVRDLKGRVVAFPARPRASSEPEKDETSTSQTLSNPIPLRQDGESVSTESDAAEEAKKTAAQATASAPPTAATAPDEPVARASTDQSQTGDRSEIGGFASATTIPSSSDSGGLTTPSDRTPRSGDRSGYPVPKDYVPAAESEHELYQLRLERFEGPLDLLLFLIRRHHIDVFDIPIAFICERYLEHIRTLEALNLDVAAEFMLMAAELLHIKSKMLLPKPAELDEEEETDPRADLVMRLLEYQKYRAAAGELAALTRLGRDTFQRQPQDLKDAARQGPLREVGVFALVETMAVVLKRRKPELKHHVRMETMSVRPRMLTLIERMAHDPECKFEQLLMEAQTRSDIVVTFLATLELTKLRLLSIYQSDQGTLYLKPRFSSQDHAVEQLAASQEVYVG